VVVHVATDALQLPIVRIQPLRDALQQPAMGLKVTP
jgi:hypothetical protein